MRSDRTCPLVPGSPTGAPIDPGPCRWLLPDPLRAPPGVEALSAGADLEPATMLAGYRTGLFAMPERRRLVWWSPDPRGILPLDRFHASGSLRRSARRFAVSIDQAFDEVLTACADRGRSGGHWITEEYMRAYRVLFDLGWAHSVEVRQDGRLAGGLLGVEVGGLFCGETMFHRATDASKVAVWAAVGILSGSDDKYRIFDVQWLTPHLASLGAVEAPRPAYLAALPAAVTLPPLMRPLIPTPALDVVRG